MAKHKSTNPFPNPIGWILILLGMDTLLSSHQLHLNVPPGGLDALCNDVKTGIGPTP